MLKHIFSFLFVALLASFQTFAQNNIVIKHGPYLQNLEENEVTIVWVASKPSVGWVELAVDGKDHFYYEERTKFFDSSNGLKNIARVHAVRINHLRPGTKYRYRIFSTEVISRKNCSAFYGKTASTNVFKEESLKFTTLDRKKSSVSFALLSDIHERAYEIPKLLELAGLKDLDLVVYNGDMSNNSNSEDSFFEGFMDTTVNLFAKEKPMYYARGNHETRSTYASHFQDYFSPKKPHLYYTFRQGPAFFVVLDTGEDKPDDDIEYSGLVDFDHYRTEQAEWLKGVLESEEYQSAPVKIVVGHVPFAYDERSWHGEHELLEKFLPLLNQHKPDLVMSGHWHQYDYFEPNNDVHFPVIVNSNNTAIRTDVDESSIKMIVYDTDGKVVDKKLIRVQ